MRVLSAYGWCSIFAERKLCKKAQNFVANSIKSNANKNKQTNSRTNHIANPINACAEHRPMQNGIFHRLFKTIKSHSFFGKKFIAIDVCVVVCWLLRCGKRSQPDKTRRWNDESAETMHGTLPIEESDSKTKTFFFRSFAYFLFA